MKTSDINIRDPFVLCHEGKYYLTGTRGETVWAETASGFDGYVSTDLENWDGPYPLFERPSDFSEDKLYWAPEIHKYRDAFYIFTTLERSGGHGTKGTWILKADTPLGPYRVHSQGKVTPAGWNCLDGTLYVAQDGKPYMVFCHEWMDLDDGEVCAIALREDLTGPAGEPWTLFSASAGKPVVQQFHYPERPTSELYVTDGPFLWRTQEGTLLMLWASYGEHGYLQLTARSSNGELTGNWTIDQMPLFTEDGGHGMLFRTFDGKTMLVLHKPNSYLNERPLFLDVTGKLR